MGAIGAALTTVFAWIWQERSKERDRLQADRDAAHEKALTAAASALTAERAAASIEVQRVRAAADERAKDRSELAASFAALDAKLVTISTVIHEVRDELTSQISKVERAVDALTTRIDAVEANHDGLRRDHATLSELVERKRKHLNSLALAAQARGIVAVDPESSNAFAAVPGEVSWVFDPPSPKPLPNTSRGPTGPTKRAKS